MNDKILPYLKAYAALIGSICTGLLAVYTGDTEVGRVLTIVSIVATTIATFAVPNLDPKGEHVDESVQPSDEVKAANDANETFGHTPYDGSDDSFDYEL